MKFEHHLKFIFVTQFQLGEKNYLIAAVPQSTGIKKKQKKIRSIDRQIDIIYFFKLKDEGKRKEGEKGYINITNKGIGDTEHTKYMILSNDDLFLKVYKLYSLQLMKL